MEYVLGLLKTAGNWGLSNIAGILVGVLGSLGVPALLKLAKAKIPELVGGFFDNLLNDGFKKLKETQDPFLRLKFKEIALILVEIAEYLIPGRGKGAEKFAAVAKAIVKIIPFLKGRKDDIAAIIEEAVVEMKSELDETIERSR